MAINNEKQTSAIMDALNAVKNKVGLSKLAKQYAENHISRIYIEKRGFAYTVNSDRGYLNVFWNYKNNEFTKEPKFGETIWIADLNTNRYKKGSWFNALENHKYDNRKSLELELGKYLYSEVNKYKDKLLLLHSPNGNLDLKNDDIHISMYVETMGYLEPEHVTVDGWLDVLVNKYQDSNVCKSSQYRDFKMQFINTVYESFENSESWMKRIEDSYGYSWPLYRSHSDKLINSIYKHLLKKYGFEKVLENEIQTKFHGYTTNYPKNSFVGLIKDLERMGDGETLKTKSQIINDYVLSMKDFRLTDLDFFIERCPNLLNNHVVLFREQDAADNYLFSSITNKLIRLNVKTTLIYTTTLTKRFNKLNTDVDLNLLKQIFNNYDSGLFKFYTSKYIPDYLNLNKDYLQDYQISDELLKFLESNLLNANSKIDRLNDIPFILTMEQFQKLNV